MSATRLLRLARRRSGQTQRALALAAGIPQSTVARIELGQLSPRTDTLERLLRAAGAALTTEPVLGIGIDRTQMRERLLLTPGQRLRLAAADADGFARLLQARR
jgi:transcriptional regulator with XRE-family HTH domain